MWPLSQGERRGHREAFLDRLITDPAKLVTPEPSTTERAEYESLVLAGGYPEAIRRSDDDRGSWFDNLIRAVISNDVMDLRKAREQWRLPPVMRCLAAQTGGILDIGSVAARAGISRSRADDCVKLLEAAYLVRRLEGFGRTLARGVQKKPKLHLADSGLAVHLLGVTDQKLASRNPATLTEFGHVLETFVANEVIKQAGWAGETGVRFYHYRDGKEREVDLVAEARDGRIAGVEVKASATVSSGGLVGLRRLRDLAGADFRGGVLLYLGQHAYRAEDRIYVVPLDRIWDAAA